MTTEVTEWLLPAQWDLVHDTTSSSIGVVGGVGSGKTKGAARKALQCAMDNKDGPFMVVEPTLDQIDSVFLAELWPILSHWRVPERDIDFDKKYHNLRVRLNGYWSMLYLRSADRPDKLSGFNVVGALMDEADFIKRRIVRVVRERIRHPAASYRQFIATTTPEKPGGWCQKMFEIEPDENTRLIRARTSDNLFLPDDFITKMLSHLNEQERQQYVEGHWVNYTGRVYPNFRQAVHVQACTNPQEGELVMGVDFGTSCSVYLLGRVLGDTLHIFDEIILEQHDTFAGGDKAAQRWAEWQTKWWGEGVRPSDAASEVKAYCDPAGGDTRNRSSSDVRILQSLGFKAKSRRHSVNIRARINAMQEKLRENALFIDPRCRYLIGCLQNQGYDDRGDPEKGHHRDGKDAYDHANDALGYLVEYRWPSALGTGGVFRYH